MACLVKIAEDEIYIAPNFVYAPGYTLKVAEMNSSSPIVDGWKYHETDYVREDFPPTWIQPTGAHDAYAKGNKVFYKGKLWESLILANVWEPGVSGWREYTDDTGSAPDWVQPTGAHDSYQTGAVVIYGGESWKSTIDANVWQPGVYGWSKVLTSLPDQSPATPAWVQPTGAQDAYALDAVVTYNGFTWKSTVANNVWEPGVYGWVKV